jgi:hypothetical protein
VLRLFSDRDVENIHLSSKVAELEAVNKLLLDENSRLRARLEFLEAEERKIRESLLRRSGLLPSEVQVDKEDRELKPVKKSILPWSQQAAKLEADSRERYWKKQIELREAPQEVRQARENPHLEEDLKELGK